jgi:tetratricopeptide (TPR) repeat protein
VFAICGLLLCGATLASAQSPDSHPAANPLERDFKVAETAYESGNFADAAALLEKLQMQAPKNFGVHELLGLSYAAQSDNVKAAQQMQNAVLLQPKSAPARTNLATALMRLGKAEQASKEYREALKLDPQNYSANHNLAGIYLQANDVASALPLLEAAQQVRPGAYDNGYDLALAYLLSEQLTKSRTLVASLVRQKESGELHNLLGRIDEKEGAFVDAANEFEVAARMDPSEDNLFIWASELLLHRTYVPAIDVFTAATKRYPSSPRFFIGLGMALYSRGEYEKSVQSLLIAADLSPHDARCYLFLSKAYLSSPQQAENVIQRFQRYADLEPANAMAQYYLALGLWKGRRLESHEVEYRTVESLLQKSISLDGGITDAHLQLGILYTDQREYDKSLPEYQRALQLSPNLPDAHFRLGRYYLHAGEKEKAQNEFNVFQKLKSEHQAEEDKARADVQQFIVASQSLPSQP